jgi:hypothetical protein
VNWIWVGIQPSGLFLQASQGRKQVPDRWLPLNLAADWASGSGLRGSAILRQNQTYLIYDISFTLKGESVHNKF